MNMCRGSVDIASITRASPMPRAASCSSTMRFAALDGAARVARAAALAVVVAEVAARAVEGVAPRVEPPVGAAGGALPLGLGGQSLFRPTAVVVGVLPRHAADRQARAGVVAPGR